MYSHDTVGLGHLRRSLLLAETLTQLERVESVLITTGSPDAQSFPLPPGCDTVKLPALTKNRAGHYEARTLGMPLGETLALRSEIIAGVLDAFRPDLVLVDHAPVGAHGELGVFLDRIRRLPDPPVMVLGLREIIDDAARVRREWDQLGVWHALDEIYDRIFVYGDASVLTTAHELGLPRRYPTKLTFTGYLTRPAPAPPNGSGPPTVVVTAGGGTDGTTLFESYADFLCGRLNPGGFVSRVITGPYWEPSRSRWLERKLAGSTSPVEMYRLVDDLPGFLQASNGAVCMAGYNTITELLGSGTPALLVPRSIPRREQELRANRLAIRAGFEVVGKSDSPGLRIADFVRRCLHWGRRPLTHSLALNGQLRVKAEIESLLAAEDRVYVH